MKLFTSLKIGTAILLAVMDLRRFSSARADDPAYYKLEDVKELTIYKEGENELRPTFSFETVAFQQINPGWGKRTSSFGEFADTGWSWLLRPGFRGAWGSAAMETCSLV
jgi:hypothetical protein